VLERTCEELRERDGFDDPILVLDPQIPQHGEGFLAPLDDWFGRGATISGTARPRRLDQNGNSLVNAAERLNVSTRRLHG
jgi:hypothetical protein